MSLPSKEEAVLELFFNEPSKQWHFENILRTAKVSRSKAVKWLAKLLKEGIVKRIQPVGKMPYYQADFDNPSYRNRKRLFALKKLYDAGLLDHLASLPKTKAVIIFGSFSRADWYTESDVDIFIYGSDEGLEQMKYERALKRDLQVFTAESAQDLEKFRHGLLQNIINGYRIKGDIDQLMHAYGDVQNQQTSA